MQLICPQRYPDYSDHAMAKIVSFSTFACHVLGIVMFTCCIKGRILMNYNVLYVNIIVLFLKVLESIEKNFKSSTYL